MSVLHSVLVTGASRGLGLNFIKELLLLNPRYLIACCRHPDSAKELQALSVQHPNLHIIQLDVSRFDQFAAVVEQVKQIVGSEGLQLLVNNAGTYHRKTLQTISQKDMLDEYSINTVAPLELTRLLRPVLRQWAQHSVDGPATVVNLSSQRGSLAMNEGGRYSYASSKAALNQITRSLSIDLAQDRIQVVSVHPGWVLTDMGGPNAEITVQESIPKLVRMITGQSNVPLNGRFLSYDGSELPW